MPYIYCPVDLNHVLYTYAEAYLKKGKDWDVYAVDIKRDKVVFRRWVEKKKEARK